MNPVAGTSQFNTELGSDIVVNTGVNVARVNLSLLLTNSAALIVLVTPLE